MEALGISTPYIIVTAVAFVVLFLLLKKFAFGPIFDMLQARQDNIRHNLDEAQSRRDEMVRLQHDYEERLAKIEDEARNKIQAAVKEAQAARDEILQRAQADAQTIVLRGQADVETQRQQAMVTMRNEVADLAIQAASRVVHSHLNAGNHAALIDEVISGVGRNGAAANGATANGGAA